jgi:long-chain fatty acid transport protein
MKKLISPILPLASAIALSSIARYADAAGFALIENSASGMGNAYAGASAVAEDASTVFFNPAGLTQLSQPQMVVAGHIISTKAEFSDRGSSVNPVLTNGTVVPGSIQGPADDGGGVAFVPNFFYARPLNEKLFFGLGINAPFGLETNYNDDWVGRYHGIKSAVQAVNINPSLAYKVNDQLSIGGGINLQYIVAELSSAVDSAAICISAASATTADALDIPTCTALGLGLAAVGTGAQDSKAELEASDIAFGYNFGLTYQPNDATRVGISYRSKVKQEAEGDAKFTIAESLAVVLPGINAGLAASGGALLTDSDITAKVDLPDMLSLSVAYQATPTIQLLGDITRTGWSSFEELRIVYASGQNDTFTEEAWEDVLRYSIGANYKHTNKITLRAGLAFDEEAIPDAEHRTPRIPGNDRTWLAFGAGYNFSDAIHLDVGFAHLFVDKTPADHTDENGYSFRGEYTASVNILSAQLNWNF